MGHRAIVAYERPDGLFNIHYSHWGAHQLELKNKITAATPLGGDENEPEFLTQFNKMLHDAVGEEVDIAGRAVEAGPNTAVDPEPIESGLRMEEVVDAIDHVMHEAFYVVEGFDTSEPEPDSITVHAYRTLYVPFGDTTDAGDNSPGMLVEARWHDGHPVSDESDKGWFHGVRNTLEELIDEEMITEGDAQRRLIKMTLEKFERSMKKRVLAHSPILNETHWKSYPEAFVRTTGRTRMLGEMYPTGYDEDSLEPWMLPDGFPLPEPVDRSPGLTGA